MTDLAALFARALGGDEGAETQTDRRILDAALVEFGAHGTQGTTVDAIADRAGVGRITIFRRFGSKDGLVERLTLRELRTFLGDVQRTAGSLDDPVERVAEAFVACVRVSVAHPLVARLAGGEPGAIVEQLGRGSPSPLDLAIAFAAADIAPARRAAGLDAARDEEVAALLVRLALSYVLLPTAEVTDPDRAREFARRALAPIVLLLSWWCVPVRPLR